MTMRRSDGGKIMADDMKHCTMIIARRRPRLWNGVAGRAWMCVQMKKLARRQNEDSQQTGAKDKKSSTAAAAGNKSNSKRPDRDDDILRQLTFTTLNTVV